MTREDILKFAIENPVFSLATQKDHHPAVRMIMMYKADNENGIMFSTWKQKDLYKQLSINPNVEMCFYNPQKAKQIRIRGRLEILDDLYLKKRIALKFKFLRTQVEKYGYESMLVCRLKKGKANYWSLSSAFDEKSYFDF